MHHCLTIPELLIQICAQCDNHSLATLGRTARLFDCALDTLWSGFHVPSDGIHLLEFVECFPPEIRSIQPDGRILFSSKPQSWERFKFYSKRVEAFFLDPRSFNPVPFADLAFYPPPCDLLPKLKCLIFRWNHDDEIIIAHRLMWPKLQELRIHCNMLAYPGLVPSPSARCSLLAPIPTLCAGITRLTVSVPGIAADHFILTVLGGLHNLRMLRLEEISTAHLPLVLALPKLTDLFLAAIIESIAPVPSVSAPMYHTLKRLDFCASPKHILALFAFLPKSPLESLSIIILNLEDINELVDVMHAVTDKCQTHALRELDISQTYSDISEDLTRNHFSPLFDFPNITHLECKRLYLTVDDALISHLATSWPYLVHLELPSCRFNGASYWPKAESLASLAFHCRRLRTCHLEFDGRFTSLNLLNDVSEYTGGKAIQDIRNPSVQVLDVGYSPIRDPELVAAYLGSLFPNLCRISFWPLDRMEGGAKEVHLDRWRKVASLLGTK